MHVIAPGLPSVSSQAVNASTVNQATDDAVTTKLKTEPNSPILPPKQLPIEEEKEDEEDVSVEDSDEEFSCYSSRGSGSSVEEPKKPKRTRTAYSNYQLDQLELVFTQTQYPDVFLREEMASRLGIREDRIQVIRAVDVHTHTHTHTFGLRLVLASYRTHIWH